MQILGGGGAQGMVMDTINTCIGAVGCEGWLGLGPPIIAKTWIQTKICLIQCTIMFTRLRKSTRLHLRMSIFQFFREACP